ncbi:MAG: DUF4105 domain-containing protein [Pirellulales bacterium]|nr:DUF4105 domain-containing protein [Pirellulales bacterium]
MPILTNSGLEAILSVGKVLAGKDIHAIPLGATVGLSSSARNTEEQAIRGTRAVAGMVMLLSALLVLSGCTAIQPNNPPADRLGSQASSEPRPAMFPTLKPNPDLYKSFQPSNDRDWTPDQAIMAEAEIVGDTANIRNIRNCRYRTIDDYDLAYYDKSFDLNQLESVDFIVAPFNDTPGIAHTMISFGFADGNHLVTSVEIRKEKGEKYDPIKGFLRQYELIYVLGDERDLIPKYANHYRCEVYVYRSTATPVQARKLFVDVLRRVNKLYEEPEFYDTLANNCTTNIRRHINHLKPDRVPYDYRVLLPGYSDRLAYDLGLIVPHGSFEETKQYAKVNYQAYLFREDPKFSEKIRR